MSTTNNPSAPDSTDTARPPEPEALDLGAAPPHETNGGPPLEIDLGAAPVEVAPHGEPTNGAAANPAGSSGIDLHEMPAVHTGDGGIHVGPIAPAVEGDAAVQPVAPQGLDLSLEPQTEAAAADAALSDAAAEMPAEPAAPPPEELPIDPAWLAGFAASLQAASDKLALLRQEFEARPTGKIEDAALADAVAKLEAEYTGLLERVRGFQLAPPAEIEPKEAPGKGFSFDEGPAAGVSPSKRPARPAGGGESGMMWQLVQVVLGGVLAIPVAQLILWWLPESIAKDPLELAPKLPEWAAFLAPEHLRNRGVPTVTPNPNTPPKNNGQRTPRPNPPSDLPPPGGERSPVVDPDLKKPIEPDLDPLGGLPDPIPAPMIDPALPPPIGPRDAPLLKSPDLLAAIDAFDQRAQAFLKADEEKRTGMLVQFYSACADVSKAVTFVDPNEPMVNERIGRAQGIVSSFHATPGLVDRVGRLGAFWMRAKDRKHLDGVLLAGDVIEIKPAGRLFETRVALKNTLTKNDGADGFAETPRVVSVLSIADPTGRYQEGSTVFVLGAFVIDPKTNLVGYSGDDPHVVWRGSVVDISEQSP